MTTSVIIPAGGSGSRMGSTVSKQLLPLLGKPVLVLTLERFQNCSAIDDIVIAVPAAQIGTVGAILQEYLLSKVIAIVAGGADRQQSVRNALAALPPTSSIVLVHDAVRPFVSEKMILDSIGKARTHRAAVVAVPVKDTIKHSSGDGLIDATIDRATLWAAQTPQTFQTALLSEAYAAADRDGVAATDDASLVERLGVRPAIIMGSYDNIKITTPEDMDFAAVIGRRFGT